jgi:glycine cleavage system transcriptional repressor
VARPTVNENYALVVATVPQATPALVPLARRVSDCGCNITEARLSTLGEDVVIALHVVGSWDAIAKLEAAASRLERDDDIKITVQRSAARPTQTNLLPYLVEVVAADKPGILYQLADFFANRGIAVEQLNSSRYRAMQTGADMFSAQITIGIPAKTHIASLRDDFLEFCDAHNLDAIMDPVKF